jgi:hypothetical protein
VIPAVAVGVPSPELADAAEGAFAHLFAQGGVVGELLHTAGEGGWVAIGDDEAFEFVGEEVFRAACGGGDYGAATGHGLGLHEGQALFDAGEDKDVAGAHFFDEIRLREGTGEADVVGGEAVEEFAHLWLDAADYGEVLVGVAQGLEGFEEVGDTFAEADVSSEEDFEGVYGWWGGWGEAVEADAVGDDVELVLGDAVGEEGSLGYSGGDGDGVGLGVELVFAVGDVGFGKRGREIPAAVLFDDDCLLEALVG